MAEIGQMTAEQIKEKIQQLMEERKNLCERTKEIELEINNLCGSVSDARNILGESKIGRPKGSTNKRSLDSIILDTVCNSVNGVLMEDIVKNIISEGYVSNSDPKSFINIIRSRLSVLKRNKKIIRDEENCLFKKP